MKKELMEKVVEKYLLGGEEESNKLGSENIGKYVILRGYDSGVHFGKLEVAEKGRYVLSDSRRLWRWWTKKGVGLTAVAMYGLSDRDEVKICNTIPRIEIVDGRVSEIIPCTDEVIEQIKNYRETNI